MPPDGLPSRPRSAPPTIAFIRTDRLGETLLTLPALAAIRRARPGRPLILVANPALCELLEGLPVVDAVWPAPSGGRRWWAWQALQLGWRLRRHRVGMVIVANPTKAWHVAAWLAGAPVRVGYRRKWAWALTAAIADDKAGGARHEVLSNMALASAALGESLEPVSSLRVPILPEDLDGAARLLNERRSGAGWPVLVVHPWASVLRKQWPRERYDALIERAVRLGGGPVAVIGGVEHQSQAGQWLARRDDVLDLVGRLSLRQLAAVLHRARVLVSNDSGPVHLAAAVGTPVVALFGTTDPAAGPVRWGPWGAGHVVLWKPTLDAISVDDVAAAVQRLCAL